MQSTDQYWRDHLRTAGAVEERRLLQKENVKENAERLIKISTREREELQRALLTCNESTRTWVSPFVSIPLAHQILYPLLKEEKAKDFKNGQDHFRYRLETDTDLRNTLNEALDTIQDSAQSLERAYRTTMEAAVAPTSLEAIREEEEKMRARTWKDIPQEELAERLSKGEVITRDEWIPGLSKGRRKLNGETLRSHMQFGRRIHTEGNDAFAKGEYELALTRYTQGVNLLNWVEADNTEDTRDVDDLLAVFLRNQAQAALQLEQYQTAKQAATIAISMDPHDGKALYRRAQAHLYLGDLPSAKNDYMSILKSPYSSTDSKMAARDGLREMRRIVSKWKTNLSKIMEETTNQDTFSSDRPQLPLRIEDDQVPLQNHYPIEGNQLSQTINTPSKLSENTLSLPFLSLDETKDLLDHLLEIYTSDEAQSLLNTIRREADFEERRVLIRARKILPVLLNPIFDEWKFPGATFANKKRVEQRQMLMIF